MTPQITVDYSKFNAGVDGLIKKVGLNSELVVRKESGELIKTLVRLSPPKEPARTKFKIETAVRSKFGYAAEQNGRKFTGNAGPSGIEWYSVDEKFLRGVLPQNDFRKKSDVQVYKYLNKVTKKGRLNLGFRHPRRRQRVSISQSIIVSEKQIKYVVKRQQSHVGRLKAAWATAVRDGQIRISGTFPKYVQENLNNKTRGRYENGLKTAGNPNFTLVNFAKGVTSKSMRFFLQLALKARGAAMITNTRLLLSGKKNIGDYAQ